MVKEFKCVKCNKSFGNNLISDELITTVNGNDIFAFKNIFTTIHIKCNGEVKYFIDNKIFD